MHLLTAAGCLSLAATALAGPALSPLDVRQMGEGCSTPEGDGTCQSTSDCSGTGFNLAGYCPGSEDIQCCVQSSCSTDQGDGSCMNTGNGCSDGSFIPGFCPGDSSIQCCVPGASDGGSGGGEDSGELPPEEEPSLPSDGGEDDGSGEEPALPSDGSGEEEPAPPADGGDGGDAGTSSGNGQAVVDSAATQEGLPYVWGGGGCSGPTGGGFDCSGLTQYAICQTQNGKTIPRTANAQYASDMGQHIPRSQAQAGDMLFWGQNGDCSNVKHVGIAMGNGRMVNAAKTGTPVREQAVWESSGSLSICPDAVRFW